MNIKKFEIDELERELEEKLKDHNKPTNKNTWVPYEKFIKDVKKKKPVEQPKFIDKYTKQLYKDLEKQQKYDQKELLKDIKKLSKELKMFKFYKNLVSSDEKIKTVKNQKPLVAYYEDKYTLKLNEKSRFLMKKFNGELLTYEPDDNIEINEQTIDLITSTIYEKYTNIYRRLQKIYPQGYYANIKISYYPIGDKYNIKSLVVKQNPTMGDIKSKIDEQILRKFIGEHYIAILDNVNILFMG
jgi:hypothetical protein